MPDNILESTLNLSLIESTFGSLLGNYDYKKANTFNAIVASSAPKASAPMSDTDKSSGATSRTGIITGVGKTSTCGVVIDEYPFIDEQVRLKLTAQSTRARIITVEGIDGAGKTTGAKIIAEKLADMGYKVLNITTEKLTDESKAIRQLFISGALGNATVDVMGMLVSAYLNSIITTQVHPNLDRYDYIIMDRSYISTLVYQRHSIIGAQCAGFIEDQLPLDIVFLFDIDPVQAAMRLEANGKELDHFEMGNIVVKGTERRYWYNQMFIRKRPNYMAKVNANKSLEWVTNRLHEQCELIVSKSVGKVWFNEV